MMGFFLMDGKEEEKTEAQTFIRKEEKQYRLQINTIRVLGRSKWCVELD